MKTRRDLLTGAVAVAAVPLLPTPAIAEPPPTAPDRCRLASLFETWQAASDAHERAIVYTDEALGNPNFPDRDAVLDARFAAQHAAGDRQNAAEDELALALIAAVAARRPAPEASDRRLAMLLENLFAHSEELVARIGGAP